MLALVHDDTNQNTLFQVSLSPPLSPFGYFFSLLSGIKSLPENLHVHLSFERIPWLFPLPSLIIIRFRSFPHRLWIVIWISSQWLYQVVSWCLISVQLVSARWIPWRMTIESTVAFDWRFISWQGRHGNPSSLPLSSLSLRSQEGRKKKTRKTNEKQNEWKVWRTSTSYSER